MQWWVLAAVALGAPSSAAIDKAVSEQLVERIAELRVEELLLRQGADVHEALLDDGKLLEVATNLHRPAVDELLARHADAELQAAELAMIYGEKHPELIAARTRVQAVRQRLEDEVRLVVRADRVQADALAMQEEALLSAAP